MDVRVSSFPGFGYFVQLAQSCLMTATAAYSPKGLAFLVRREEETRENGLISRISE
jgi:hypothetical protein